MPEDLKSRTCVTCACAYLVEPPRVPTAEQLAADPQILNRKPLRICRLNPPMTVYVSVPNPQGGTQNVPKLMQQPTDDYFSCWHWREAGMLPGDALSHSTVPRLYDGN
jgi:hypothetical protein